MSHFTLINSKDTWFKRQLKIDGDAIFNNKTHFNSNLTAMQNTFFKGPTNMFDNHVTFNGDVFMNKRTHFAEGVNAGQVAHLSNLVVKKTARFDQSPEFIEGLTAGETATFSNLRTFHHTDCVGPVKMEDALTIHGPMTAQGDVFFQGDHVTVDSNLSVRDTLEVAHLEAPHIIAPTVFDSNVEIKGELLAHKDMTCKGSNLTLRPHTAVHGDLNIMDHLSLSQPDKKLTVKGEAHMRHVSLSNIISEAHFDKKIHVHGPAHLYDKVICAESLVLKDGTRLTHATDLRPPEITQSSNAFIGIGTSTPVHKLDVHGDISTTGVFRGRGAHISHLDADHVNRGTLAINHGGTGKTSLGAGQLLVGDGVHPIRDDYGLVWDDTQKQLSIQGAVHASRFSGQGQDITDLDARAIQTGILPISRGGTGRAQWDPHHVIVSQSNHTLTTLSALTWKDKELKLEGHFRAQVLEGSGAPLTDLDARHINQGELAVKHGGTGADVLTPRKLLVGNGRDPLTTPIELDWDSDNQVFNVVGDIRTNSLALSSTQPSSLSTQNEALVLSSQQKRIELALQNQNYLTLEQPTQTIHARKPLYTTSLIAQSHLTLPDNYSIRHRGDLLPARWTQNANNKYVGVGVETPENELHVGGLIRADQGFIGDGSQMHNLDINATPQILSVPHGGTGRASLQTRCMLLGNGDQPIQAQSEVQWNDQEKRLTIEGSLKTQALLAKQFNQSYDVETLGQDAQTLVLSPAYLYELALDGMVNLNHNGLSIDTLFREKTKITHINLGPFYKTSQKTWFARGPKRLIPQEGFTYKTSGDIHAITPITSFAGDARFVSEMEEIISYYLSTLLRDASGRAYVYGRFTGLNDPDVPTIVNGRGAIGINTHIVKMAASFKTQFFLDKEGNVYALGDAHGWADRGQLGANNTQDTYTEPVKLSYIYDNTASELNGKDLIVLDIMATKHIDGIAVYIVAQAPGGEINRVFAWGKNKSALGNGMQGNNPYPIEVSNSGSLTGKSVAQFAVGKSCWMAVATDGTLHTGGYNSYGEAGLSPETSPSIREPVDISEKVQYEPVKRVSIHEDTLCVTESGRVFYWGRKYGYYGFELRYNNTLADINIAPAVNLTGQHSCLCAELTAYAPAEKTQARELFNGRIVVTDTRGQEEQDNAMTINDAVPRVKLSDAPQQKNAFGVISHSFSAITQLGRTIKNKVDTRQTNHVQVNAIGEGRIWVSDENGPIESGDFITTSSLAGYGMRQSDDLVHNYTVAKSTMHCAFKKEKSAFISCVYMCG